MCALQTRQREPPLLQAKAAGSSRLDTQQHDTCSLVSGSEVQLWQPAAAKSADVEQGLNQHSAAAKGRSSSHRYTSTASVLSCSEWGQGTAAAAAASDSGKGGLCGSSSSAVPMWCEVWVLTVRFFRCWMRTPIMATAEAAQYLILAVFLGLLYLRTPATLPNAPYDKMSSVFLVLTMLAFTPSYTVLVVWDHERQLLRRESGTNMYRRWGRHSIVCLLFHLLPTCTAVSSVANMYCCFICCQHVLLFHLLPTCTAGGGPCDVGNVPGSRQCAVRAALPLMCVSAVSSATKVWGHCDACIAGGATRDAV
jgi:hypothetical protein